MNAGTAALFLVLALPSAGRSSDEPVDIEITPRTCVAPCSVRLAVRVPVNSANRAVTITADSVDYYRSSTRQLEGVKGPRYHELLLERLPAGQYEISVTIDRGDDPDAHRAQTFEVHGDSGAMHDRS